MGRVLTYPWFKPILLAAFLTSSAQVGLATTVIIPRDDDLIIRARAIVRGKVLSVSSSLDEKRDTVVTYVTLRVKEVFKGEITSRRIVIKEPGGVAEGRGSMVFGAPQFTPGERVLLYLDTWPDGSLRVLDLFLGKFSIVDERRTGEAFVLRTTPGSHVEALADPRNGAATDHMNLMAYSAMVRDRLAANREVAKEFEARYYHGIPLLARPPEYAAKASGGSLQPQFHLLFNARWFEPDDGQPVVFMVNPEGAPSPQIMDDVAAAMNAWSTVPGSSLRVVNGGTTDKCQAGTGLGTITFSSGCWPLGPDSSVLAFGGLDWTFTTTKVVNGVTFSKAIRGFVSFNPNGGSSDSCGLREIATHEMGHALGLHHSWDPNFEGSPSASDVDATMYYIAHFDGRCASLRSDDMNGIRFIYPGSGGESDSPTILTSALANGIVGLAYSRSLEVIGGTSPYTWSLAGGSGPLPAGLSLSANGVISGTPSAEANSLFTIRVTDSASRVGEKEFSLTILASGSPLNSQLVSQTVPPTVEPGSGFNVTLIWRNTGTELWSGAAGIRIGSQNPPNNRTWGGDRVLLPGSTIITPGQQLAITFTAFAPATPGTFNLQFQLVKEGVGFFGDPSTNVGVNVVPGSTLTIAGPSAAEAVVGLAFSLAFSATGGVQPYTWSIASGALPASLSLSSTTGLISGAPAAVGTANFTVEATDTGSRKGQKAVSIKVSPPPVQIATVSLPPAIQGSAYTQQLNATGGTPPYTWTVTEGALPSGLTLNQVSGAISGTPSVTGTFGLAVAATDQLGVRASRSLQILVVSPESVPHLRKVRYKADAEKLTASGENFNDAATLLVDERQVTPRFHDNAVFVVKQIALTPGSHAVRVINPNGISSEIVTLTVN